MPPRLRIVAFGSAGLLVLAGALSAAVVGGVTGQVLTMALLLAGLGGALLLVFLEVGLSEDREKARRETLRRRKRPRHSGAPGRRATQRQMPRRGGRQSS